MKRLLLGAAVAAVFTPTAFGQVQADWERQAFEGCGVQEQPNSDEIILTLCHPTPLEYDSEISVIGTRIGFEQQSQFTAPTSVLTVNEIEARGQQHVSDLLRSLPGIAVNSSGPAGGLTQIRVRGAEANQVLVIIDGVEVANPSSGEFDFAGLRSEDIVRIETLRGEQSALYGSDAIGGVINIITRSGSTQEGWRVSLEAGARETVEGQVSAVIPIGGASLSINGNAFNTEGFDISGLDGERDGSESRNLTLGLNRVELGPVTLSGNFRTSRLDVEFDEDSDFDGTLNNSISETTVRSNSGRIDARFDAAGFENLITAQISDTDTDTAAGFSSRSIGQRRNINWAAKRGFGNSSFTALGEIDEETYQIIPNFTEPDAEPDNLTYAVAGDYRYNAGPIAFSGSARYDINDLFSDAITWRVGAGYKIDAIDGRIRGSIGTGIKNPSLIELFGFFPQSMFTGNSDLEPESSLGFSLGYEQEIGDLNISVDLFRSELEDEITTIFNPDFTTSVANLDSDSTRQGVEVEARWSVTDSLFLRGSATYLDSEQDDIEEVRRPEFIASATATWQATDALSLTANIDHNGSQLDTDFGTFSTVTLDAFTLIGGRASYKVNDFATLSIRGENLADEDYEEVFGFASPGRAVFGGLSLDF